MKITHLLLMSMASLIVSCGPVYKTRKHYIPPRTREGMTCVSHCSTDKNSCINQCVNQKHICNLAEKVGDALSGHNETTSTITRAIKGGRSTVTKKKFTPGTSSDDEDEEDIFGNTDNSNQDPYGCKQAYKDCARGCGDAYDACYAGCGGQVDAHQECVAFCERAGL